MKPLNALDLTLMPCGTPGCTHDDCRMWLHSVCHPRHGTFAIFSKTTGNVQIVCARCKKQVALLALYNPLKHTEKK